MVTGIVDVGGGMRGIYSAGILDSFIESNVSFDVCIGVSAGSANLISFLANQEKRNYKFYTEYAFRKNYMGLSQFLKTGSYVNLDYIYGELSYTYGENPLDYEAISNSSSQFYIVATDAKTGKAKYFSKSDLKENNYKPLMASSCLPGVNKPYYIKGFPYFDGALSDPVPFEKAFELGCDKVLLILTKPIETIRTQGKDLHLARLIKRKYPLSAKGLLERAERYNNAVAKAKELQKEGKVLILAPDDISGVDTLKKDKEALKRLYSKGLAHGKKALEENKEFFKK